MDDGDFHPHDAAGRERQPVFHRYGVGDVITDAVGHVGPLQGEIGLRVGRIDPGLDGGGAVDQRHHLPHDDIPLAVEELEADFGQRQGFFGVDEIAFGGEYLFGHGAGASFPLGINGHGVPATGRTGSG